MADLHPPKLEIFDPVSGTNTDPKGTVRQVEEYRRTSFGLYMARPAPGRAQFSYLESWILPSLGIRITDFWSTPGHEREQDFYIDVVSVTEGEQWVTKDLYLDLVVQDKRGVKILDTDELLVAAGEGYLTAQEAEDALKTTYRAIEGLARHGYHLQAWLSTMDIELTWRRR